MRKQSNSFLILCITPDRLPLPVGLSLNQDYMKEKIKEALNNVLNRLAGSSELRLQPVPVRVKRF